MLNTRSIHFRLVLWYVVITLAICSLVGWLIYESVRAHMYNEVSQVFTLRDKNIAEHILPHVADKTPAQLAAQIEDVYYPEASNRFIRLLNPDGSVLYISGHPKDGRFDPKTVAPPPVTEDMSSRHIDVGDVSPLFIVSLPAHIDGKTYIVENGGMPDVLESTLDSLVTTQVWMLPALLLILSGGGLMLVRRALKPVDDMRRTAAQITFGNLENRLPVSHTGDSLEQLAVTLNQMLSRLEDAYDHSSRFAADAAHELRTPLAIMRGELESFAMEKKLPETLRARAESMLEESERLTRITDMLLALSRLDAGESKLGDEKFDLAAMARDTAEQMALLADEKDISLDIRAALPVNVRGDASRLKEVVVNLLDNAVKYTPRGGRVNLSVFAHASSAVIEVEDSGIGIPAESLPHVFERFYRVDKARSREEGGTGLGLSIAQSICLAHQGSIEIESAEGKGTLCRVLLPLAA